MDSLSQYRSRKLVALSLQLSRVREPQIKRFPGFAAFSSFKASRLIAKF